MKKGLLFLASMMLTSVAAVAQQQQRPVFTPKATIEKSVKAPVAKESVATPAMANRKAPRRVPATGLWYKRPEGSFQITSTQSSTSKYTYLVVPPFIEQTFANMADDAIKPQTFWTIGESELTSEPNGDLVFSNDVPPEGYVNYLPTLNSPDEDYTYGQSLTLDNYCLPVDTIYSLTHINRNGGYYIGFSNGYVFGTNEGEYTIDEETEETAPCWCRYITEFFEKPAHPFYMTDVWFHFYSNSQDPLPQGVEMTLTIYRVNEDGSLDFDDPIAVMPFTADDIVSFEADEDGSYGAMLIVSKEVDAFGGIIEMPVLIEDEFAIRIDGFNQEGVDFTLYMADAMAAEEDNWEHGGLYPTVYTYVNADGEVVRNSWQFRVGERQFNAVMFLDGMFDVAYVEDDFKYFTAPTEGGIMETVAEFEYSDGSTGPQNAIEVYCTLPWESTWEEFEGEENYFIVSENEDTEFPSWLKWTGFSDKYFADYHVNLIQLTADALPADVTGRYAKIRIVSDRGADTGLILITQGDVEVEGISHLTNSTNSNGAVYSLSGQKVSRDFKGLVIENGRKLIRK